MKNLLMDPTTYGGLSTARYVAFRDLSEDDAEKVKEIPTHILGRASSTMSRISFVDELRYQYRFDETDIWQCMKTNDLELYLLCTCLDTLAGKEKYYDLGNWLQSKKITERIQGSNLKIRYLKSIESSHQPFTLSLFQNLLRKIIGIYTSNYGINQNIRELLLSLPEELKKTIAEQYTISERSDKNESNNWDEKNIDEKIKAIFIGYLFKYRRNKYTHEGSGYRNIGGICSAREALSNGIFDILPSEPISIDDAGKEIVIECKYGDEALFLREVIIACLANQLGVLNEDWIKRYRQAERMRRMLIALIEEIKYNKRIMQGYFGVLIEGIRVTDANAPTFKTSVAEKVLEEEDRVTLPIYYDGIRNYIIANQHFNENIATVDVDRSGFQKNRDEVSKLISESDSQSRLQFLWLESERLLTEYPYWTYH